MDSVYLVVLSAPGRALMLSLIIGISMQGIKATTPPQTWLRAMLPAIPILFGAVCGLVPGILTGDAKILLGAGAGALSSSIVELFDRYKWHIESLALKKVGIDASPAVVLSATPPEPPKS